jgi:hypothetical protein
MRMVTMSLEEAEWIARNRLPEEPREDEIAAWRRSRPSREPARRKRGLNTMPAEQQQQQIDWADVINRAIRGERAHMVEAIGEHGNGLLAEVEGMIAQAINQVRAELRVEFARELDGLRNEIFAQVDVMQKDSGDLRARLEEVKKKRTRPKATNGEGC